ISLLQMETLVSSQVTKVLPSIKTICVLGGSKLVASSQNIDIVSQLVRELGKQKINLLYGGTSLTFFGSLLLAGKGFDIEVKSVLPFHKTPSKVLKDSTSLMLSNSIYDCTMLMVNHSDAFIILPGGYETLMTMFTIASWADMKLHNKPIGLLNSHHIFNGFI
ncbi:Cytokinin riboside 5-monophosphate phosphoribohydrolase LOG3, partial [Striga hermonthica]